MKWKNHASDTTVYFITATITEWQPLFMHARARDILFRDLEFYRAKYGCQILAYVVMPDHYHLVLHLQQPDDLHRWLRDMQSHSANELAKWLQDITGIDDLAVYTRHANGDSKLAVWKEQSRAFGIISDEVLRTKIDYIHNNPVKRELVDDPSQWPWSSWHSYHRNDDSIFRVDKADCF